MDGLKLRHLENILYRENELSERIALLHKWTSIGNVDLFGFEELIKQCTVESVELDAKRKSGGRIN